MNKIKCFIGILFFITIFSIPSSSYAAHSCASIQSVSINDEDGYNSIRPNQPFICTVVTDKDSFGSPTVSCGIQFKSTEPVQIDYCVNDSDIPVTWTSSEENAIAHFHCIIPEEHHPEDMSSLQVVGLDTSDTCADAHKKISLHFIPDPLTVPGELEENPEDASPALIKKLLALFIQGSETSEDISVTEDSEDGNSITKDTTQEYMDISDSNTNVQLVLELINQIKKHCQSVVNGSNYTCVKKIHIPDAHPDYVRLARNEIIHSATSYANCNKCETVFQCVGFVQSAYFLTYGKIPPRKTAALYYKNSPGFISKQTDSSGKVINTSSFAPGSFCVFDYNNPWGHIAYLLEPKTLKIAEANYRVRQGGGDVHIRDLLNINGQLNDNAFLGCAPFP